MMKNLVGRLVKEEEGQALTEYGLLVGLIAIVIIGVVTTLGTELLEVFTKVKNKVAAIV
jgi:pilus assembly protein Flp/PilA